MAGGIESLFYVDKFLNTRPLPRRKTKLNYSEVQELEDNATHNFICDRSTENVEDLI